jgi:hypothetical protein
VCVTMAREHLLDSHQQRSFVEGFQEHPVGPQREGGRPPSSRPFCPPPLMAMILGFVAKWIAWCLNCHSLTKAASSY